MKHYTLVFIFDRSLEHVVLIKKNRPDWMAGSLNGIGGKVEKGETAADCAIREVFEETGAVIDESNLEYLCTEGEGKDYGMEVLFYITECQTKTALYKRFATKTDEEVVIVNTNVLRGTIYEPTKLVQGVEGYINMIKTIHLFNSKDSGDKASKSILELAKAYVIAWDEEVRAVVADLRRTYALENLFTIKPVNPINWRQIELNLGAIFGELKLEFDEIIFFPTSIFIKREIYLDDEIDYSTNRPYSEICIDNIHFGNISREKIRNDIKQQLVDMFNEGVFE